MKKIILLLFVVYSSFNSFSQIMSSTQFIQASISDGEKLTKSYLLPLEHSMAFANSDGNINFTKNERKISFNFGLSVSSVSTMGNDLTFDVNDLGLDEVKPSDPNKTIAQTFFGDASSIEMETKTTFKEPDSKEYEHLIRSYTSLFKKPAVNEYY